MKEEKRYQGYHTHPSNDSSAKTLKDGTVLVLHDIERRESLVMRELTRRDRSVNELLSRFGKLYPAGGYGYNHIKYALDRLVQDGVVKYNDSEGRYHLTKNGREHWENLNKRTSTYKK